MTLEENGEKVEKKVNQRELDKLRLERARALDAEKYAGERTTPLTPEEREALQPKKKRSRKKAE